MVDNIRKQGGVVGLAMARPITSHANGMWAGLVQTQKYSNGIFEVVSTPEST